MKFFAAFLLTLTVAHAQVATITLEDGTVIDGSKILPSTNTLTLEDGTVIRLKTAKKPSNTITISKDQSQASEEGFGSDWSDMDYSAADYSNYLEF